jgi:hypothetical protein
MLFPRAQAWTRAQRRSIIAIALLSVLVGGALIYGYERYYRGPSESAFYGTWEATLNEDLTVYYEFRSDHSFLVFGSPELDEESFLVRGRWYAGGPNMYLRYLDEGWDGRRPEIWHLVDIQSDAFRIRYFPDSPIHLLKRVHRAATPASNQTMERTADRVISTL